MRRRTKKIRGMVFGCFLVLVSMSLIFSNYLLGVKFDIFNDYNMSSNGNITDDSFMIPELKNYNPEDYKVKEEEKEEEVVIPQVIDYSKYYGVLEIPKIGLKRGFYNVDSEYNNIEKNVSMIFGSNMPDVDKGNLMLMAHSGTGYLAFFRYLYKLNLNDVAYVTYKGTKYKYKIVNIYEVPKNGRVTIKRNYDKTTLTLVTCTKGKSDSQTVYILEMI